MQTSKKRIYGAAGLATVAGMTVVAHSIPAPEAYAQSTSVSATAGVQVTVLAPVPDDIISGDIQDGGATSKPEVDIPVITTNAATIRYTVVANQSGQPTVGIYDSGTIDLPDDGSGTGYNGTYDLDLKLKQYADELVANHGYTTTKDILFTLTVTTTNITGGVAEDSITFVYAAVTIDPNTNINPDAGDDETNVPTEDNGDPVIDVGTNDEVETVHVIVRNDETGEIVWEGDVPASDVADGKITLPFAENGIPSGNYTVEVYAYDSNGNLIGGSSLDFRYVQPDSPGLPNTGGVSIAGLNIAQSDFLISSALVFCLVSLGGIYLLTRRARK